MIGLRDVDGVVEEHWPEAGAGVVEVDVDDGFAVGVVGPGVVEAGARGGQGVYRRDGVEAAGDDGRQGSGPSVV